jgi:hypothetical protein
MRLVLRRARQAKGLLLAACLAALVATAMVSGLADYNRQAMGAGQRSVAEGAPPEERSLLVSGSAGRTEAEFAKRDGAVRARFAGGLGGVPVALAGARYGTGRQLTGDLGPNAPASKDPVFASMVAVDDLPRHADLLSGAWPRAGRSPLEVVLPERAAKALEVGAGDRIPLTDRGTRQKSEVTVAGVFRPRDAAEPYWRLVPGVGADAAGTDSPYGPFLLDRADFSTTFTGTTSASWLVEPTLAAVDRARFPAVKRAVALVAVQLPDEAGLGTSAQVNSKIDRLVDRLARADLVGRSALLTPILLIIVLGGYALVLVAALLNEDRRGQTALLRARGAARRQLAGLAAREAALVVLPGAALAPLLASQALRYAGGTALLSGLDLQPRLTPLAWAVAGAVAVGCLLAMLGPALRRGGTYLEDLAARSRPDRWAAAQRASLDVALVALAALAWFQLRQYSSPLAADGAGLGIDPLLAAAPTLGVLAGAVIALRLLPPATRFAERFVNRKPWTATMLGMWQAGRRPHAGPVLLLALAVGGSTLAWSLVSTWQRSLVDQANHQVGADLRVTERNGSAPDARAAQLAALPGVRAAVPAWRDSTRVGRDDVPTTVLALDAATAPGVVRLDDALVDGSPRALWDRLVAARGESSDIELPPDARRLTGTISTTIGAASATIGARQITTVAILGTADGLTYRVPVGGTAPDGRPARFAVDLPDAGGRVLRLAGFDLDFGRAAASTKTVSYGFRAADLGVVRAEGGAAPLDAGSGGWALLDGAASDPAQGAAGVRGAGSTLSVDYRLSRTVTVDARFGQLVDLPIVRLTALRQARAAPVPAALTPEVIRALSLPVGETGSLQLPGGPLPIRVVGVLTAVPGSGEAGAAVLLDLPSAASQQLRATGVTHPATEWWLGTGPGSGTAAAAAARLPGVTVLDRVAVAHASERDPYWRGARTGLLAAAGGAVLLAVVGLGVDVWATGRRRLGELAVLHTLGATPRLLARSLLAEQAFLAGIGVVVGLVVGGAVSATMAPLVILTPAAGRPVPDPVFELPARPVAAIAAGLLAVAMALGGLAATAIRRRVTVAQLRIGGDQ